MPLQFTTQTHHSSRKQTWTRQNDTKTRIPQTNLSAPFTFHKTLPLYTPTPLVPLDAAAKELGVKAVYIKDESSRFGLPSFKATGASWGTFRALVARLGMRVSEVGMRDVGVAARERGYRLFAATDGNHGRAVAWMARLLGIPATVYVPVDLHQSFLALIEGEGAEVVVVRGDYDAAVRAACAAAAARDTGVLVQDTAFEGYEDVPAWIIDGYSTLFAELEVQLREQDIEPTTIVTPVGVGSLAQSVITYAKSVRNLQVIAVEPDTAACLHASLTAGEPTSITTFPTINSGLNCGTVSTIAWPYMRDHVDISTTVSDFESHADVLHLTAQNVSAGPCGASGLAALRRLVGEGLLSKDSVVLLINTEAARPYDIPLDVGVDDVALLTSQLVQIDSSNPSLSSSDTMTAPGETKIAQFIAAWLQHRGIETHMVESVPGRPSVVGVVRGTEGGKSIMLNAHTDTVALDTYGPDALSGKIENGRIYGRGVQDMKAGLAASMTALLRAKLRGSKGDVILAAVADEEDASIGTSAVLAAGWTANAALVPEPTAQQLHHAHKGFAWFSIKVLGNAAHGSDPSSGIDAIMSAAHFIAALEPYAASLPEDEVLGKGTMHCGTIAGGAENSSYAASCTVTLEFRTVGGPAQTSSAILDDISAILASLAAKRKDFFYEKPELLFERAPLLPLASDDPFLVVARDVLGQVLQTEIKPSAAKFWTDAALLTQSGIPALVFGPTGEGLHGLGEWVDVESVRRVEECISRVVERFVG